jgi:hypothetical protein
MSLVPEIKEYIEECRQRFISVTKHECIKMDGNVWGNMGLIQPMSNENVVPSFWSRFSLQVEDFLNFVPTKWKFRSDKHELDMGKGTTMIKTQLCEYVIFQKAFRDVVYRDADLYLDCSIGLALLYVMAVEFVVGGKWLNDRLSELDCIWFSSLSCHNNSPMMRLFRLEKTYPLYQFNITKQKKLVQKYPPGTYLYVRGVYMWMLVCACPNLGELMKEVGLHACFQGENVMVVGPDKLVGYWQDPDTHQASYTVKTLKQILKNLKDRFMEQYNKVQGTDKKKLDEMVNYVMERSAVNGVKYTDPLQMVGITNALRYCLIS